VVTWYDQSGNSNDATQATTTRQPKIYDGSAVIVSNGKSALQWGTTNGQYLDWASANLSQPNTVFVKCYYDGTTGESETLFGASNTTNRHLLYGPSDLWSLYAGAEIRTSVDTTAEGKIFSALLNTTSSELRRNGSSVVTGNAGTMSWGTVRIGNAFQGSAGTNWNGTISEMVIYNSNQSSNYSGIESDINTYYSIY
jgi:hypothetical protein